MNQVQIQLYGSFFEEVETHYRNTGLKMDLQNAKISIYMRIIRRQFETMKVLKETKKSIDPENYKIPIFTGNFKMEKSLNASGFYIRRLKAKFFAFLVNCSMSRILHLQLAL